MPNKTIGPKIKEFRKRMKLTQEQLAESLGYSGKSVISHIEKGDADMTYEKIALLLKIYQLDANELFAEDIDENSHNRVVVYIHGLNGSAKEANDFSYLSNRYDVKGLNYKDGNPWEVGKLIRNKFAKLIKPYKEVIVIANSIGAFYTYQYLSEFNIKKAFFISPIASMLQSIINLMNAYGIKDRDLQKQKFIELDDGTILSYDFYRQVSDEEDAWKVPTEILYGAYDEVVYFSNIMEFLENHPLTKLTIKEGGEHYFHTEEDKEFIKEWILKNID